MGEKWVFKGIAKPTELVLALVSLYSHAEPNCSMVFRYIEIFLVCILHCRGGVPALKTCFALHFTAEMWRVRIKGMSNVTLVMFLLALLTKGSSKIMQQYLIQKKSVKSYFVLINLKHEYLTAHYLGEISLKYGRWAATCSSPKRITEIKKIFKIIKSIAFFSECNIVNVGQ